MMWVTYSNHRLAPIHTWHIRSWQSCHFQADSTPFPVHLHMPHASEVRTSHDHRSTLPHIGLRLNQLVHSIHPPSSIPTTPLSASGTLYLKWMARVCVVLFASWGHTFPWSWLYQNHGKGWCHAAKYMMAGHSSPLSLLLEVRMNASPIRKWLMNEEHRHIM